MNRLVYTLQRRRKYVQPEPSESDIVAEQYRKLYQVTHYQLWDQYRYQKWLVKNQLTPQQWEAQRGQAARFKYRPLISIVVPVYKPPVELLEECLDSVVNQTYDNWQLCVVDDKSADPSITKLLNKYAKAYGSKFAYKKRTSNGHISKASNDALKLARGEFVALLDNDDLLWPNALFEVVKLLNHNKTIDFIYTDEDKLEQGLVHAHPYMKPAYDKVFLAACNYITHLAVLRTDIVRAVGGFRTGLEGAQDWDLFLRISEQTDKIVHLPKMLYSWRVIETSTAKGGFDAKPYAYDAQQKATSDHLKRMGVPNKGVILPKNGFVGWMPHFDLPSITLTVILNDYTSVEDIRSIVDRLEADKSQPITLSYWIVGDRPELISLARQLRRNNAINIKVADTTDGVDSDYVLCVTGLFDAQGCDGWLENMLGYLALPGNKLITAPIEYSDHTVDSAGIVFTNGKPTKLLNGYYHGCDERLDTALMSPRSVQTADNRVFLCTGKLFHKLRKDKIVPTPEAKQHDRTVFTPFVSFFTHRESESKDRELNPANFTYDVEEDSPYWGTSYI